LAKVTDRNGNEGRSAAAVPIRRRNGTGEGWIGSVPLRTGNNRQKPYAGHKGKQKQGHSRLHHEDAAPSVASAEILHGSPL